MSKQKAFNLIVGAMLLAVGVILILCGVYPNIIDILLGVACCVAAVALTIKSLIHVKKALTVQILIAAVLLAAGIALFLNANIGAFIQTILNIALITVGTVILIDTIVHFVKKRALAVNIIELIFAVALITIGIVALIPNVNIGGLIFYFSGAVICFAGLVAIIASLINFKKYLKAEPETSNQQPKKSNKKSKK